MDPFFFYDRFPDPDHRKRAERWSDLSGGSGCAGASFGNPFHIPYDRRRRYQASVRTWRDHGAADSYSLLAGAGISLAILISTGGIRRRFLYLYQYMNEFYCTGEIRPYYRKGMSFPENFHFTVPIFLSAVLYAGGVY